MQSITLHEIVVGIIVGLIVLFVGGAITKGYGWANSLMSAWNDRYALNNLATFEEHPATYADQMLRRHRLYIGLALYLVGADLVIAYAVGSTMTGLKIIVAGAAAVVALVSSAAGRLSTEAGVRDAAQNLRKSLVKRGRLPVEDKSAE